MFSCWHKCINILQNCEKNINPSEKVILTATCSECESSERLMYMWRLSAGSTLKDLDWISDTTTGRYNKNLVIKAETLGSSTPEYILWSKWSVSSIFSHNGLVSIIYFYSNKPTECCYMYYMKCLLSFRHINLNYSLPSIFVIYKKLKACSISFYE